ncbi:hypothetical protein Tco_1163770 [Tanacetum coccineum]
MSDEGVTFGETVVVVAWLRWPRCADDGVGGDGMVRIVAVVAADKYGYIKNHKKTVKNGQARTRESEEYKKKPKNLSLSQKQSKDGQTKSTQKDKSLKISLGPQPPSKPCYFVNPRTSSPPYQPFSPTSDYTTGAPPTSPIISPPLSPIKTNSNENYLLTPKSTPPPLTTPPLAPTQPSKLTSPVAINLDPIELLFYTPPSSPSLLDVIGDLPPSITNPSPSRLSFATIEHLANEPPPIPLIDSTFPRQL